MQTPDLHLFSSAQQPTHTFSVLQLEFVLPSYNQASRAGHQTRHKNWWLLFNNNKTMLSSIHESKAMASTQLLFFIPAFHTLSRCSQLFYQPQAAVWVVTQTYTCSSYATPRQEAWLVSPTGDSHFPSTALKVQLQVQRICAYILPVVSLNMFLCKITVHWKACILKYTHDNIYVQTHI